MRWREIRGHLVNQENGTNHFTLKQWSHTIKHLTLTRKTSCCLLRSWKRIKEGVHRLLSSQNWLMQQKAFRELGSSQRDAWSLDEPTSFFGLFCMLPFNTCNHQYTSQVLIIMVGGGIGEKEPLRSVSCPSFYLGLASAGRTVCGDSLVFSC